MNQIDRLAAWLRDERARRQLSARDVAELAKRSAQSAGIVLSLSQQSVSAFEQGAAKRVPSWLEWVEKGFRDHDQTTTGYTTDDDAVRVAELPTFAGAGGGGTGEGDQSTMTFSRSLVERELRAAPDDLLAVLIEGNSMDPDFQSGDRLLIDKRKTSLAQPGAFCLWDGDGYVVKYLERLPGSEPPKVRVISRNSIFSTSERLVEEIRIMGRVVWLARRV